MAGWVGVRVTRVGDVEGVGAVAVRAGSPVCRMVRVACVDVWHVEAYAAGSAAHATTCAFIVCVSRGGGAGSVYCGCGECSRACRESRNAGGGCRGESGEERGKDRGHATFSTLWGIATCGCTVRLHSTRRLSFIIWYLVLRCTKDSSLF